jgi:hypothetical protein
VADEVRRLLAGESEACRAFRVAAEQGHYASRTYPTCTRQGLYVLSPDGLLLGSDVMSATPWRVESLLVAALERWRERPPGERAEPIDEGAPLAVHSGMALKACVRDLVFPDPGGPPAPSADGSWNLDYVWLTQYESRFLAPEALVAGAERIVPRVLVERLARFHFVDSVRGETRPFAAHDIEVANLVSVVTSVREGTAILNLSGETSVSQEGFWPVDGFHDVDCPVPRRRGVRARLLGSGRVDVVTWTFSDLEIVAVATRWGGSKNNGRAHDLEPSTIGLLVSLSDEGIIPPAFLSEYEWLDAPIP